MQGYRICRCSRIGYAGYPWWEIEEQNKDVFGESDETIMFLILKLAGNYMYVYNNTLFIMLEY